MQSQNSIPIAIVIAGILVAGSIIFVERNNSPEAEITTDKTTPAEVTIRPVSTNDHIVGSIDAPVILVEYSDTECPFCKRFHETMNNLVSGDSTKDKIAWVYRHLPLTQLHSKAFGEAVATECAWKQGGNSTFWKYINEVYSRTPTNNGLADTELTKIASDLKLDIEGFKTCRQTEEFKDKVNADADEAFKAGGSGTPFTVAMLKKDLDGTQRKDLQSAFDALGAGDYIQFTGNPKMFILTGAMPQDLMEDIITILTR